MKKILIFLGPPGSGKGTQAKRISEKYGYSHVSTGDILRNLAKEKNLDETQQMAVSLMKEGKLVPDEVIYTLTFKAIDSLLAKGVGIVLDGAIRTVAQAEAFQKHFKETGFDNEIVAIVVSISDEEALKRLAGRRVCSRCGEIIPAATTRAFSVCPKCSGELVSRPDDNEVVVRKRLEAQGNAALKPILEFYTVTEQLHEVDGTQSIEGVEKDIEVILTGQK